MGKSTAHLVTLLVVIWSVSSSAQDLEVQTLRPPSPGDAELLGVHTTAQSERAAISVGSTLNYVADPLVLVDQSGKRIGSLVGSQWTAELAVAYGLFDWLEVSASLPLVLAQSTENLGNGEGTAGVGDSHLIGRVRFFGDARRGLSLGARGDLSLPTGINADYAEQPTVGFVPGLVAEWRGKHLLLTGNASVHLRERTRVANLSVGSAAGFGAGLAVKMGRLPLYGLGELVGQIAGSTSARMPIELRAGLRGDPTQELSILGGYGRGIVSGYGAPDHRALLTVAYRKVKPAPLPAARKAVPVAEVPPNPDPDQDGIPSVRDRCPEDAEDYDGVKDEDGCPELDNDGDGLADDKDACRNDAEDVDAYRDEDGCPDPDNDLDGIADASDRCPLQKEIINGVDDDDGCPDEGRQLIYVGAKNIAITDKLFFANDRAEILPRSEELLAQLATTLIRMPWLKKVRIEGHTDDQGTSEKNIDLSQRRAESVRTALVARGVAAERFEAKGYGEEHPIDTNRTLEGRANNRRVEFVIVEQVDPAQEPTLDGSLAVPLRAPIQAEGPVPANEPAGDESVPPADTAAEERAPLPRAGEVQQ